MKIMRYINKISSAKQYSASSSIVAHDEYINQEGEAYILG